MMSGKPAFDGPLQPPLRGAAQNVTPSLPANENASFGWEVGSSDWIEACWLDMQDRAQAGELYDAYRYISLIPNPRTDQIVDLVYSEFLVRRDREINVSPEQFLRQYPEVAGQLARQLAIDDALSEVGSESSDSGCLADADTDIAGMETRVLGQGVAHASTADLLSNGSQPDWTPPSEGSEKVGRYILIEALRRGSQADVYRAFDPLLKRDVVIKIEPRHSAVSQCRFSKTEAIIAANLNHPNLAPALDAGSHQGRMYSVSRYIRGQTFDQWVRTSQPAPEKVAGLLADIARGLAAAHATGTLHLDVKPQNILVDENEVPYLIDFGLSVLSDVYQQDSIDEGVARGTLQFMSPEQIKGEADKIGPASDIFGLGATLFMGLVGRPPYGVPKTREDLLPIEQGRWREDLLIPLPLGEEIRTVVAGALAADPADRYSTCAALASDLERIASADRSESHVVERPGSAFAWRAGALGAALLVLLSLTFWALPRTSAMPEGEQTEPGLAIHVGVDGGRFVDLAECVPLVSGTKLRISGVIPAGQAGVLFAVAPDGTMDVLSDFDKQAKKRGFEYPQDPNEAVPLLGEPGTELIGVCLGESLQSIHESMAVMKQATSAWDLIPEMMVLHLTDDLPASLGTRDYDGDGLQSKLAGNSRRLGEAIAIDPACAAVTAQWGRLAERVRQQEVRLRGVAFRHIRAIDQ